MADARPTEAEERIETLDVVRGFALFGILIMNIVAMGLPFQAYNSPAALGPPSKADETTFFVVNTLFEGSMRTLFSMLFGAGFYLLLDRMDKRGLGLMGAKIYSRRVMLLLLLGLFDMFVLLWGGDILFAYGLAALLLLPFWKSTLRGLVVWASILFVALSAFTAYQYVRVATMEAKHHAAVAERDAGRTLNDEQKEAVKSWEGREKEWVLDADARKKAAEPFDHGWAGVAGLLWEDFRKAPFVGLMFGLVFDSLFGMILGMIAYRVGVMQGRWTASRTAWLAAFGFGLGLPLNAWETWHFASSGYAFMPFIQTQFTYHLGRVLLAFGWLGVFLLICKAPWLTWLRVAVGSVGRMALTNYLMHSLLASIIFVYLGWWGDLWRHQLYYVVAGFWAANIVFSMVWLHYFRMGPVEWLWRAGTYGEWPQLWKKNPQTRAFAPTPKPAE